MIIAAERRAWVTVVTTDSYVKGALVLAYGLASTGSKHPFVILHTGKLLPASVAELESIPDIAVHVRQVFPIHPLSSQDKALAFAHLNEAWAKFRVWELTEFDKICFLDADMLVVKNMDDVFDLLPEDKRIAAAPTCTCNPGKYSHFPKAWIPSSCQHTYTDGKLAERPSLRTFNSGLFVTRPSKAAAQKIIEYFHSRENLSNYPFADQCLLNELYPDWHLFSYEYNALKTMSIAHEVTWKSGTVKNVHYLLSPKPWDMDPNADSKEDKYHELHKIWFDAEKARVA
ncbi:nucleotide-diphospho-sugar transferase, partial [Chytriomyces sp. MP71]